MVPLEMFFNRFLLSLYHYQFVHTKPVGRTIEIRAATKLRVIVTCAIENETIYQRVFPD